MLGHLGMFGDTVPNTICVISSAFLSVYVRVGSLCIVVLSQCSFLPFQCIRDPKVVVFLFFLFEGLGEHALGNGCEHRRAGA